MKKLFNLLLTGLVMLLFAAPTITAFAVGNEDTAQTVMDDQNVAATLHIDTQHTYAGMDCSYAEGYRPKVRGNAAQIVLPLVASGAVKDNLITAKADIDFSAESPFVCKNYEKAVAQRENQTAENISVSGFAVEFYLELTAARKNGNYPVTVRVTAADQNGAPIAFETTVYVSIADGKAADSETDGTEEAAATLKIDTQNVYPAMERSYGEGYRPQVVDRTVKIVLPLVTNGAIKDNRVSAKVGIDFSAESPFVCKNYEKTVSLSKHKTVGGESVSSYLVAFDLQLTETAKGGNYPVTITVNAIDRSNQPVSFETVVYVVIADTEADEANALKMEFDELQLPAEVTVSDVIDAPIKAMNLSSGKAYHVRASLKGDGLLSNGTAFLGDMEPGTAMDGSFSVSVTALSDDALYGNTDGVVTYTYEDETGKEYIVEKPFSTRILSPFSEQTAQPQDNPRQWWVIMAVVGAVLAAAIVTSLALFLKRRGRS